MLSRSTSRSTLRWMSALLVIGASFLDQPSLALGGNGELTLSLIDSDTGQPVAARIVLRKAEGRPGNNRESRPIVKVPKSIPDGVGIAIDGSAILKLPDGVYQFEVVRGPEYRVVHGSFQLERDAVGLEEVKLPRFVDMASEGWISGDLGIEHDAAHLDVLMRAEDLHACAFTPEKKTSAIKIKNETGPNAWTRSDLYRDPRATGLSILGSPPKQALGARAGSWEIFPQALEENSEAVIVGNPTDWDLPFWLATGQLRAFAVLHPEVRLDRPGKWIGREPSEKGFLAATAHGTWAERVWRYALEAGFKLPAVAVSGSAAQGNPVGYNRVYVHCEDTKDPQQFWRGVWEGRSVVTNGPLMRPLLGGRLPGDTIRLSAGATVELAPDMRLAVRDPVSYMEVVFNDRVLYSARLDEVAKRGARTPPLNFDGGGWVIMRVITDVDDHWRAAVSSPWWIDVEGQPRISRKACVFFQQWLEERISQLAKGDRESITAATPYVRAAREFWKQRIEMANVD